MHRVLAGGLMMALIGLAASAQEGLITIKVRKGEVGDTVRITKHDNFAQKTTITANGEVMDKAENKTKMMVYTNTVLERAPGTKRAIKTKRTFETAEGTQDDQVLKLDLAGKTVLIVEKDKTTTMTFEDGTALTKAQLDFLQNERDNNPERPPIEEVILPKKPVRPGESWTIDLKALSKGFDDAFTMDETNSKATGTLKKVYTKEGRQFGIMAFVMELTVTKLGQGEMAIPLKGGSKMTIEATIDTCIDGSVETGTMDMMMKADFEGDLMGFAIKLGMQAKGKNVAEPVLK